MRRGLQASVSLIHAARAPAGRFLLSSRISSSSSLCSDGGSSRCPREFSGGVDKAQQGSDHGKSGVVAGGDATTTEGGGSSSSSEGAGAAAVWGIEGRTLLTPQEGASSGIVKPPPSTNPRPRFLPRLLGTFFVLVGARVVGVQVDI